MSSEASIEAKVAQLRQENQRLQRNLSLRESKQKPVSASSLVDLAALEEEASHASVLTIVVIGASGDLAKKKTYPSLFELFKRDLLPPDVIVVGFARSELSDEAFRKRVGYKFAEEPRADEFLARCTYFAGTYSNDTAFEALRGALEAREAPLTKGGALQTNRVYYLAIPPSLFADVARNVHSTLMSGATGWSRLVVEKPFGRDLDTFLDLSRSLQMFNEEQLYRIDHYLGKEMVQNLMVMRFANAWLEPLWNRQHVQSVVITFKEDIDVEGRGGYFDSFGIVRDVMQNHLLQILALAAMEPPVSLDAEDVRDEKVKVLRAIKPIDPANTVLGQYGSDATGKKEAYLAHSDVPDDSVTPTFATAVMYIDNSRWRGVPFILKAGKALNERKAELRVQFRETPAGLFSDVARNELVLRVQPAEAIYMKVMTKEPGLETKVVQRELDLTYSEHFEQETVDAYSSLILDVVRGDHSRFVRDDELLAAWRMFTPWLQQQESERTKPVTYEQGSRGPTESDDLCRKVGYVFSKDYTWVRSELARGKSAN